MQARNPYRVMVSDYARLLRDGATLALGGLAPPERPRLAANAPKALIFSPHPDDECIVGALPLRLLRELGMHVVNVAVTLGSRKERQAARWRELEGACAYIGFRLLATVENGLEHIDKETRDQRPELWASAVGVLAEILSRERPQVIFMPHEGDWNRTHIGTHFLVLDALSRMAPGFACTVVETEFWGAMAAPNLMVESSVDDVADLVAALSFHVGEVRRNAYHLRLPAWMTDNVRRGGELVLGQGATAPDFAFATLYRLRRWTGGRYQETLERGRLLACGDDLETLLA